MEVEEECLHIYIIAQEACAWMSNYQDSFFLHLLNYKIIKISFKICILKWVIQNTKILLLQI